MKHRILSNYFTAVISLLLIILFTEQAYSQEAFSVKNSNDSSYIYTGTNGSVALDTSTTLGTLTIGGLNGIIATGTYGSGTALNLGTGTIMMWYPKKAAFRAGFVSYTQWCDANIGDYSTAMGNSTVASGWASTAMGQVTTASGNSSTAMGNTTTASGYESTSMGYETTASGTFSTAMGDNTTASGDLTTAMGFNVSTNNFSGSFIIGDNSSTLTTNSRANNQMAMRFANGYIFYTNANLSTYVFLAGGQSSWNTTSDSTKKYAFLPVSGESVLSKLSKFNLRTWSYKGQDSTQFRHYGPMAQEFFAAFGHDKYGVAGNDTTINQADFEGINLIAIQALEKEVRNQRSDIRGQKSVFSSLKEELELQKNTIAVQQKQINELNKMKTEFTEFKNAMSLFLNKSNNGKAKLVVNIK